MVLALVAVLYVGPGLVPGRVLLPLDILDGLGAWKEDPDERRPAANAALSDAVLQFLPWDTEVRRQLVAGRFPWIDPYSGEATPLFTNPQTALLSPFTWPRLVLGEQGWGLCVFLRLWIAGLAMLWLASEMGAARGPALVSALVYQSAGLTIVWSMYPLANVTATMPLFAAATIRLMRDGVSRLRVVSVIAAAALATAGGHPESLAMGVISTLILLGWTYGWEERRRLSWVLGAAFAGFLLLAVVTIPFLIAATESWMGEARSERPPFHLRPSAIVAQILPGFLGGPLADELDLSTLWGPEESFPTRSTAFVGAVVLVGLAATGRGLPLVLRRGLAVGVAGLVLSWCLPGIESAMTRLPLLKQTLPGYRAVGFVLFGAAAAGPALFALASRRRVVLGSVLAVGGLALIGAGLTPGLPAARPAVTSAAHWGLAQLDRRGALPNPPEIYEGRLPVYLDAIAATARRRVAIPGLAWLLVGMGLLVGSPAGRLVIVGAVGELVAFGFGYLPSAPAGGHPLPRPIAALAELDPDRSFLLVAGPGVFPPNLGTVFQVRDLRSYSLLESAERMRWMRKLGYERVAAFAFFGPELKVGQRDKLAAAGVRFFLSREAVAGAVMVAGGLPPRVGVYELPGARRAAGLRMEPPPGVVTGALLSVVALGLAIALSAGAARVRDA